MVIIIGSVLVTNNTNAQPVKSIKVEERITRAQTYLQNESHTNPNEEREAVLSFENLKSEYEVLDFIRTYPNIKVSSIFHVSIGLDGSVVNSGGVAVDSSVSITEDALMKARDAVIRDKEIFGISGPRQILTESKSLGDNPKMVVIAPSAKEEMVTKDKITSKVDIQYHEVEDVAYKRLVESAKETLSENIRAVEDLKSNGLSITGLSIVGTTESLNILQKDTGVRVIELRQVGSGLIVPPIIPTK